MSDMKKVVAYTVGVLTLIGGITAVGIREYIDVRMDMQRINDTVWLAHRKDDLGIVRDLNAKYMLTGGVPVGATCGFELGLARETMYEAADMIEDGEFEEAARLLRSIAGR